MLIRNSRIPPLFVLLPGKLKVTYGRFIYIYIINNLHPVLDPESLILTLRMEISLLPLRHTLIQL